MDDATAPRLRGPIDGGCKGTPFAAIGESLASYGYSEHEYFLEGTARRFAFDGEPTTDGEWSVVPTAEAPFATRILVVTPDDPAGFNGTVLVDWINVSAGFEILALEDPTIWEQGFAYVAISAQHVGVHGHPGSSMGLVQWDDERYGALRIPGDSFSYDIFTQGARAVSPSRSTIGGDPMRGLEVKQVIATGGSQSASRLATYLNAVQAREQVFDAVMLFTYFGFLSSIDSDATLDLSDPDTSRAFHHSDSGILLRTDLDIPVMVVNSECETLPHFPARQPDSEWYRFWEVAGTSHATVPDMGPIIAKIVRDGVALPTPEGLGDMPPMNAVSWHPVLAAALAHLQRWVTGGQPPPSMPRISVAGEPPQIERDELGIAIGGIRLPQVEVPTAAHSGVNGIEGPGFLYGSSIPFDEVTLHRLYPDHDQYVAAVTAAAQQAHDDGVLLAAHAAQAVEAAKGTQLPVQRSDASRA